MTHQEMSQNFPSTNCSKLELVVLREHDGEHMWQRTGQVWHRLEGEIIER